MELDEVTAYARERLGLEIQAVIRLPARQAGRRQLQIWSLMTEHGHFWLVKEAGQVELFRATHTGPRPVRRFLELHPEEPAVAAASPAADSPIASRRVSARIVFDCRLCGRSVTRQRATKQLARQLCSRCAHAERERERYRDDPEYRARCRAADAARRERAREGGGL